MDWSWTLLCWGGLLSLAAISWVFKAVADAEIRHLIGRVNYLIQESDKATMAKVQAEARAAELEKLLVPGSYTDRGDFLAECLRYFEKNLRPTDEDCPFCNLQAHQEVVATKEG